MKKLFVICLIVFVLSSFAVAAAPENRGVIMPHELCQISCQTSDGDNFTMGVRTEVIIEKKGGDHCTLNVDKYYGVNGVMTLFDDYSRYDIPDETVKNFGAGYDDTYYPLGFTIPGFLRSMPTALPTPVSEIGRHSVHNYLYMLMYRSYAAWAKTDYGGEDGIVGTYVHQIDGCAIDNRMEVHYSCDAGGNDKSHIACHFYNKGVLTGFYSERCDKGDCDSVVEVGPSDYTSFS